uniref:Uncharacterized protein n=1 Tax=Rhizophora mucronata TaxID=61149 RepID=A0A2P2NLE3_RHIMU
MLQELAVNVLCMLAPTEIYYAQPVVCVCVFVHMHLIHFLHVDLDHQTFELRMVLKTIFMLQQRPKLARIYAFIVTSINSCLSMLQDNKKLTNALSAES